MLTKSFHSNRSKLRPDSRAAVEAWVAEINSRNRESAKTLTDEGIKLELWLLEEADDGLYLVSVMETDDYEYALEKFASSQHDVDDYHRKFLENNVVERKKLRVLSATRAG